MRRRAGANADVRSGGRHPHARQARFENFKEWALAIARRSGSGKARVAFARKLTVILHSIWRSGEPFRWASPTDET